MKKLFVAMVMALAMGMVSSVALASPYMLELNSAYTVDRAREEVNKHLSYDTKFYSPMEFEKEVRPNIRAYVSRNNKGWAFSAIKNQSGNIVVMGIIIPGRQYKSTIEMVSVALLNAAPGKEYIWGSKESEDIKIEAIDVVEYGHGCFYCNDMDRVYCVSAKYEEANNRWFVLVFASPL